LGAARRVRYRDWPAAVRTWFDNAGERLKPGEKKRGSSTMPLGSNWSAKDIERERGEPVDDAELSEMVRQQHGPMSDQAVHQIVRGIRFEAKERAEEQNEAEIEVEAERLETERGQ
jgi:hypothetical protein